MDALAELAKARRAVKRIDLARMIELVPTGRLQDLWDASADASSMLSLYQYAGDHRALVRACLACADWARRASPRSHLVTSYNYDETRRAVDDWLRGLSSATDVRLRSHNLFDTLRWYGAAFTSAKSSADKATAHAAKAIRRHVRAQRDADAQELRDSATSLGSSYAVIGSMGVTAMVAYVPDGFISPGEVAGLAAFARGYDDATMLRALAEMADIVRKILPCPNVDALVL